MNRCPRRAASAVVVLGALILGPAAAAHAHDGAPEDVAFTTIAAGSDGPAVGATRLRVIDDAAQAQVAGVADLPADAPVDFSRHRLAGVFLGSRSSVLAAVEVRAVRRERWADGSSRLVVEWAERGLPPGVVTLVTIARPFVLVRLPRTEEPVDFQDVGRPDALTSPRAADAWSRTGELQGRLAYARSTPATPRRLWLEADGGRRYALRGRAGRLARWGLVGRRVSVYGRGVDVAPGEGRLAVLYSVSPIASDRAWTVRADGRLADADGGVATVGGHAASLIDGARGRVVRARGPLLIDGEGRPVHLVTDDVEVRVDGWDRVRAESGEVRVDATPSPFGLVTGLVRHRAYVDPRAADADVVLLDHAGGKPVGYLAADRLSVGTPAPAEGASGAERDGAADAVAGAGER